MTKKRIATMATCIALVGAVAVGGTLALLASESKQLTNTFTVGNNYESGDFLLKEHGVTQTTSGANVGDYTNTDDETQTGVTYGNVIANSDLAKDPFFELVKGEKDTPASWIVAKVNNIQALNAAAIDFSEVSTGWKLVTLKDGVYTLAESALIADDLKADTETEQYFYVYETQLTQGQKTNPLFTKLHAGNVAGGLNLNIDVKGVAVQAVPGSSLSDASTLAEVMAAAADKLI